MEAAQCAWEYFLDYWPTERENHGSTGMRYCARLLAPTILRAYDLAKAQDPGVLDGFSYDWEFVPWVIENLVIRASVPEPQLRPDWEEMAGAFGWLQAVERISTSRLKVPATELADPPQLLSSFKSGETPDEFVTRITKKFDLHEWA